MLMTIADCIAVRARSQPEHVAIEIVGGGAMTYGEAWRRVEGLAAALRGAPPGPHGRMVGLLLGNGADAVLSLVACARAGVAAVPVNSRLAAPEVAFVLQDSGAGLLLTDAGFAGTAAAAAKDLSVRIVRVEEIPTPGHASEPPVGEARPDDEAFVVGYTSGTTGFPKGAVYTHHHYLTLLLRWGWEFGISAEQVMLVPGPLFHLSYAGLSMGALAVGARIRIMPAFDPELALDELSGRCSFAFLVPSMTGMIAEAWKARREPPVPALRLMLSSGAPGPLSLTETAMRMFNNAKVCEAYGWTEGGWVTFEIKRPETLLAHSVGWPTVGNEVAVFDEAGEPCGVGQPGEVGVRSLSRFGGYLGRPEATEAAWHRGYVLSGDIGIWQPDGRLCIVDRKKDMIVTGGENVYTAEVERVLVEHPQVLEAAVVGLPDERWGELVTAMIVPRGEAPEPAALAAFCRERLAGYKVPKRLEFVAELPRNPMGKVQKFRIVERLAGRAAAE